MDGTRRQAGDLSIVGLFFTGILQGLRQLNWCD